MTIQGKLQKMHTEYNNPIRYYLNLDNRFIDINQLIGKRLKFDHLRNQCMSCGLDKPIFRMGFCHTCFYTVPQASPSIINPELSQAHLGKADRDLEWEITFQMQPHIVYLALSGGLKVGVTRKTQIPYRWIDQGASFAVVFAETQNRYEAGMIEVLLKENLPDKTNWQRMLTNQNPDIDLLVIKHESRLNLNQNQSAMYTNKDEIWEFHYPIHSYPVKIKSISLAKQTSFEGKLQGIRGQYLYFENGLVFNIRNHEGYVVNLTIS
ncbi:MAG: DUF2797 domain-containing protein [Flavobacteriaceae bacterium]|nr:DUF2797 domain-containing protein [Flavobacteriaceae bacterium]